MSCLIVKRSMSNRGTTALLVQIIPKIEMKPDCLANIDTATG